MRPPGAAVFAGGGLEARELAREELPALQAFFDANPRYFVTVTGAPAPADAAVTTFEARPPPHLAFTRHPCLGLFGADGAGLQGVVFVACDFCLPGVWHLSLFMVDERHHGRGVAAAVHASFEAWARAGGAHAVRLSVVLGNERAERFWQRLGYVELRRRERVDTGGRLNTVRVMLKPLLAAGAAAGEVTQAIEAYLQRVPRDQPGSTLA